jgi:hypothetical protein
MERRRDLKITDIKLLVEKDLFSIGNSCFCQQLVLRTVRDVWEPSVVPLYKYNARTVCFVSPSYVFVKNL